MVGGGGGDDDDVMLMVTVIYRVLVMQCSKISHASCIVVDRKRGLGCKLMTSGTSPPQYVPHRRTIIANSEKSL